MLSDRCAECLEQVFRFFELQVFSLININIFVCVYSSSSADRKEFIENYAAPFYCVDRQKHF